MEHQSTSPRIAAFKKFVQNHPNLIKEVRNNNRTWKDIFEEWVVLGEDHEIWNDYHSNKKKQKTIPKKKTKSSNVNQKDTMKQLLSLVKKVDYDDLQNYMSQFNDALSNIEKLMKQYQDSKTEKPKDYYGYGYDVYGPPYPPYHQN